MNKIEKISTIIIIIGLCWMIGKVIYGIGYRNGMINNNMIIEYEQKIDIIQDACNDKVEQAKIDGRNEILEMF